MLCFTLFFLTCTSTSYQKKKNNKILADFQGHRKYEGKEEHKLNARESRVENKSRGSTAFVGPQCVPLGLTWTCMGAA